MLFVRYHAYRKRTKHLLSVFLFLLFFTCSAVAENYYINLLDFPKATGSVLEKAKHDFSLIGKQSVDDIPPWDPDAAVIQGERLLLHFRGSDYGNTQVFCFDTDGNFLYGYKLSCADYTGIALTPEPDNFIAVSYRVYPATIAKVNINKDTIDYYEIPGYTFGNESYSMYYESDWSIANMSEGRLIIFKENGNTKTIYDHSDAYELYQRNHNVLMEKDQRKLHVAICICSVLVLVYALIEIRHKCIHDNF